MTAQEVAPPHNNDAEQALLASAILDNKTLDEIVQMVRAEDFYRPTHQAIFDAMVRMHDMGEPIDMLTLRDTLNAQDSKKHSDMGLIIMDIMDATAHSAHWKRYAEIVRDNALYRRLINIGVKAQALGYEAPADVEKTVATVQSDIIGLSLATSQETLPVSTVLSELWKNIKTGHVQYFQLPWLPTVEVEPGDLVVLAAGASVGKTAISLNWVDELSKKYRCTMFEYEMPETALVARLVCKHAGVTMQQLRHGDLNPEEVDRVQDSMLALANRNFKLQEVWCDITALMAKIRREAMEGAELVVIDHIGLVPFDMPKGLNDAKAIGVCVTGPLKRLASELGIVIVALSQLNREGQMPDKFPSKRHLRDSGNIEQDASIVIMAWSDEGLRQAGDITKRTQIRDDSGVVDDNELLSDSFNLVRLGIEKQRNGPRGHKWLLFHGEHFRYEDRDDIISIVSEPKMFGDDS